MNFRDKFIEYFLNGTIEQHIDELTVLMMTEMQEEFGDGKHLTDADLVALTYRKANDILEELQNIEQKKEIERLHALTQDLNRAAENSPWRMEEDDDLPPEIDKDGNLTYLCDFSDALDAMKNGYKVARKKWKSNGYWFIDNLEIDDTIGHIMDDEDVEDFEIEDVIVARLANGKLAIATPYMEDLLAEDWVILAE